MPTVELTTDAKMTGLSCIPVPSRCSLIHNYWLVTGHRPSSAIKTTFEYFSPLAHFHLWSIINIVLIKFRKFYYLIGTDPQKAINHAHTVKVPYSDKTVPLFHLDSSNLLILHRMVFVLSGHFVTRFGLITPDKLSKIATLGQLSFHKPSILKKPSSRYSR